MVGSDSDLRNGESTDLLPFRALDEGFTPDPSSIWSKMNCVELEGMNSSLAGGLDGATAFLTEF